MRCLSAKVLNMVLTFILCWQPGSIFLNQEHVWSRLSFVVDKCSTCAVLQYCFHSAMVPVASMFLSLYLLFSAIELSFFLTCCRQHISCQQFWSSGLPSPHNPYDTHSILYNQPFSHFPHCLLQNKHWI